MRWTADSIVWGVDDSNYYQYVKLPGSTYGSWPFDFSQYMLLNVAVGGVLGGTPNDALFPIAMEIDYVRVYQP